MANTPIEFAPMHLNGSVGHKDEIQSGIRRVTRSNNDHLKKYSVLEVQAAANWHRIIEHTRDIRVQENMGLIQKPKCPQCERGNHQGPKCRICGTDVSISQAKVINEQQTGYINSPIKKEADEINHEETVVNLMLETEAFKRRRSNHVENSEATYLGAQLRRQKRLQEEMCFDNPLFALRNFSKNKNKDVVNHEQQLTKKNSVLLNQIESIESSMLEKMQLCNPIVSLESRTATTVSITWETKIAKIVDENSFNSLPLKSSMKEQISSPKSPLYDVLYCAVVTVTAGGATDDSAWKFAASHTPATHITIKGLSPNTLYNFKVRSKKGDWGEICPIRTGPAPPSAPKRVCAKEISSESVLLVWQPVEKDNGLPVTEYTVHMKKHGEEGFSLVHVSKERLALVTNLKPNMIHVFEVRACNKAGAGDVADRLAVRTLLQGAASVSAWEQCIDPSSGRLYYCHPKTGASTWTLPNGATVDPAASYRNKRLYLADLLSRRRAAACAEAGVEPGYRHKFRINRSTLLRDSLTEMYYADHKLLQAGVGRVEFIGEDGIDAGGLAKDWFSQLAKSLLADCLAVGCTAPVGLLATDPDTGFVSIDASCPYIYPLSDLRWMYEAVGCILAKSILDNQTLGLFFSPILISLLFDREATLDQLEKAEPALYRGLKWVSENDVTGADLTFSVSFDVLGDCKTVELVENGEDIIVTEENKKSYVDQMAVWLIRDRCGPALQPLKDGMAKYFQTSDFEHFNCDELQTLFAGQSSVEAADILRGVLLEGGLTAESPLVQWLWSILDSWPRERLSSLLSFATGCSCLPADGLDPPLKITAMAVDGPCDGTLPKAHTCFNQLVLPEYSSRQVLEEKLLFALSNTGDGFFMS